MNTPVVNEHVIHFEIGRFAVLLILELNEGVAQRVARLAVSNYLATSDGPESREDKLEVFVGRDRVELANEQNVLGRLNIRVRNIADDLEQLGARLSFALLHEVVDLFLGHAFKLVDFFVDSNSIALKYVMIRFITLTTLSK